MSFSIVMLFWYIFPVVVLFAGNFIVTTFSLTKRYKIKAPDLAVPFLLLGLTELSKDTFQQSIFPFALLSVLLLGICVAIFQAYYYGDLLYGRYLKMFWRLAFLVACTVYFILIILNIGHYLFLS